MKTFLEEIETAVGPKGIDYLVRCLYSCDPCLSADCWTSDVPRQFMCQKGPPTGTLELTSDGYVTSPMVAPRISSWRFN
jgi:hypothetical protein